MDFWVNLLQTFGLAVVILFAIGVGIWRMTRWFGAEIVIPFRDRLITKIVEAIDHLEDTLERIDRRTERTLEVLSRGVSQVVQKTEDVKQAAVEVRQAMKPKNGEE